MLPAVECLQFRLYDHDSALPVAADVHLGSAYRNRKALNSTQYIFGPPVPKVLCNPSALQRMSACSCAAAAASPCVQEFSSRIPSRECRSSRSCVRRLLIELPDELL